MPAVNCPGFTDTFTVDGAVPDSESKVSQVALAATLAVHARVPLPLLEMLKDCEPGSVPPRVYAKLKLVALSCSAGDEAAARARTPIASMPATAFTCRVWYPVSEAGNTAEMAVLVHLVTLRVVGLVDPAGVA